MMMRILTILASLLSMHGTFAAEPPQVTLHYQPPGAYFGDPIPFYHDGVHHVFYLHKRAGRLLLSESRRPHELGDTETSRRLESYAGSADPIAPSTDHSTGETPCDAPQGYPRSLCGRPHQPHVSCPTPNRRARSVCSRWKRVAGELPNNATSLKQSDALFETAA